MHRSVPALALALSVSLLAAATATAAPGRETVIVKFRPGTGILQRSLALQGAGAGGVLASVRGVGAQVVGVLAAPGAVAARLSRSRVVDYAEVNRTLTASSRPNDARFRELYGLDNTAQTGGLRDADIDAPQGWDAFGLGAFPATGGVKIGIVDTGIRATHQDLAGKVVDCARSLGFLLFSGSIREGGCADDNGHGTHVAGTAAAVAGNGVGVAGVAFNSPLSICKALGGSSGSGSTSDVANCIGYLHDKGAKVISMSLGGGDSITLRRAVQAAYAGGAQNGSLLVAAAGNRGDASVEYPAAYDEVVSVAATDARDRRAPFSNANPDVELAAPGVDILSTFNASDSSYVKLSGTSMATPYVAGVAALIAGRNAGAPVSAIRARLDAAVDDLGVRGRDPQFGFGRANLLKAAGR